ncbi:SgrR family transcriptional regulator [Paenibacillus sp. BK720]|uniref:SgrR family transcriptional regulator n=1 Tax=Paenibacillus sp. BK720 TaxID=2587092 RepID=UPI001423D19E|nr:SgrR family transcriptional regulator [Paenibacillus sp. BK720]NIK71699.1 MarR-like DNA-binding transcriptional regulator SgrR of sgrS sRNA [Paenibacillus sp. BK720]
MLLDERYLTLYERFGGQVEPVEVTLEEVSELLYCTPRNAYLHPSVRGVNLNPLGWIDFKDVWLEEHD